MSVVTCEGVTFGYGPRPVVEDVSLTVEPGEFLGLVGPNGSGKSTLLQLFVGALRPDVGSVRLFGEPAHAFADGTRIGYVPQGAPEPTLPITVRETVALGRTPHAGWRPFTRADRRAVRDALDRADVADIADRRLGRLSGGQRQRALIARALAAEADLLALDEPVVGLDAEARTGFYGLLGELNEGGMTVVLVEHDLGVVTERADRVACLNRSLHFHGVPAEFDGATLAAAYGAEQGVLTHDHP